MSLLRGGVGPNRAVHARTSRPVIGWILAVLALAVIGAVGYMVIEGGTSSTASTWRSPR